MHLVLLTFLAFHSATVIVAQVDDSITLGFQFGDTIYTAEFSRGDLKPDTLGDGDRVQAEVKNGRLTVKLQNGKTVSARVHWVQRVLIRPLPEP